MTLTRNQETQLLSDVAAILVALEGNGLGSSEGVIERVHKLERADEKTAIEIRSLRQEFREWRMKIRWSAVGMGVGAGFGGGGLVLWISRFLPGGTP